MLRWRIVFSVLFIALIIALAWLDHRAVRPGIVLLPLALVICAAATQEFLQLTRPMSSSRHSWSVYGATLTAVAVSGAPILWPATANTPLAHIGWWAAGVTAGIHVVVIVALYRFAAEDEPFAALSRNILAVAYVGGLLGWLVQLRIVLPRHTSPQDWGMLALISLLAIVKGSDIGAYCAGNWFGRHQLAPRLSPGKTWEGLAGGIAAAVIAAWLVVEWFPAWLGLDALAFNFRWATYAILLALAGLLGDLTESMLKRNAGAKDSSSWLPGLGGTLDLLDSLLVAAPVATLCWSLGWVGP